MLDERAILDGGKISVESLLLMEARPCGGESDGQIVEGAWDFPAINHRYAKYLEVLEQRPGQPMRAVAEAKALRQWAGREREAWLHAVTRDPLLPAPLLPPDYAGRDAWRARVRVVAQIAEQLSSFRPE